MNNEEKKVNEAKEALREVFTDKPEVTKKEIKTLLKTKHKKQIRLKNFFTSLFKKIRFVKYRKRNKKLMNHKSEELRYGNRKVW